MTWSRVSLESFEAEDPTDHGPSEDYQRGFDEGIKDAEASHSARVAQSTEALSATLSDMTFGFTEARVQLLDQVRPLLSQVADAVVPIVLRESFTAHLVAILTSDFETSLSSPVEILVPPDMADHLHTELGDQDGTFIFTSDPALNDGQAIIVGPSAQTMIDLATLTLDLQTALNGLEPLERTSHG